MEKHLKCIMLHHNRPFLKLGPFKYEYKHTDPEIGLLHDFISENESLKIRQLAKGRMKSTPYTVGGEETSFSKGRTSKVRIMELDNCLRFLIRQF